MKYFFAFLLLTFCSACAANPNANRSLEQQATVFFEQYIELYNRRLDHPEYSESFRSEMARLIHEPILSAPLNSKPTSLESSDKYASNLESFVAQLESLGVTRLQYQQVQLHVLTPNKIIANNIGRGFNDAGDILYETVSIYFLYRTDTQWQIAMLNAYDIDNALSLN